MIRGEINHGPALEPLYPNQEEALYLHDVPIQRFGGRSGTLEHAAALMQILVINEPFVDGNKRVAFALMVVFLKINGLRLTEESTCIVETRSPLSSQPIFRHRNTHKFYQYNQ
mgnify:FL=1